MRGRDEDDWIIRALRALHDEPGYDQEAALARFRADVERMETDPEYAEHIRRIAEEADADLKAMEEADE
jgi:hypothetical protein